MTNPKHYAALMTSIDKEAAQVQEMALQNEGFDKLWQAAVMRNDGVSEQEFREKLHTSLDQLLDLRTRILQLVRRAT